VPGDHVAMSYISCGTCGPCTKGHPTHCDNFFPV
jgi:aryl-alcohol dehydrogenase